MNRLRPLPVSAFCGLTLLIWGNRIWLAWTNTEDTLTEKVVWSLPITAFVVVAAVLLVAMLRGAEVAAPPWSVVVRCFAAGTVAYWAVRLPLILLADHPLAFDVVHGVLALVSTVAACWAWTSVVRRAPGAGPVEASEPPSRGAVAAG